MAHSHFQQIFFPKTKSAPAKQITFILLGQNCNPTSCMFIDHKAMCDKGSHSSLDTQLIVQKIHSETINALPQSFTAQNQILTKILINNLNIQFMT